MHADACITLCNARDAEKLFQFFCKRGFGAPDSFGLGGSLTLEALKPWVIPPPSITIRKYSYTLYIYRPGLMSPIMDYYSEGK